MKLLIDGKGVPNVSYLKVVSIDRIHDDYPNLKTNLKMTIEYQNLDRHEIERSRCTSLEIYDDVDDGK